MAKNSNVSEFDFTQKQFHQIATMSEGGATPAEIARDTGIHPVTLQSYLQAVEVTKRHQAVINPDGTISSKRALPSALLRQGYEILRLQMEAYCDKIRLGEGSVSPGQMSMMMGVIEKLDKIERLNVGAPTEIHDYTMLSIQDIRFQLENLMPKHIVMDAQKKVEDLMQIDWEALEKNE